MDHIVGLLLLELERLWWDSKLGSDKLQVDKNNSLDPVPCRGCIYALSDLFVRAKWLWRSQLYPYSWNFSKSYQGLIMIKDGSGCHQIAYASRSHQTTPFSWYSGLSEQASLNMNVLSPSTFHGKTSEALFTVSSTLIKTTRNPPSLDHFTPAPETCQKRHGELALY